MKWKLVLCLTLTVYGFYRYRHDGLVCIWNAQSIVYQSSALPTELLDISKYLPQFLHNSQYNNIVSLIKSSYKCMEY